jgi:uncharacterized protein (TIGR03435 family)
MRVLSCILVPILAASAAFAQTPDPPSTHFDAADVHPSQSSGFQFAQGPLRSGLRYDIHHATMVDLILRAYDVTADKVIDGPNWVEYDRFDISAVTPPKTSAADAKLMLKALLADRFQLVVRPDERPLRSYVLTAPKGKQKMKESDGTGETGCRFMFDQLPRDSTQGLLPTPSLNYTCRNMTMAAFAEQMIRMAMVQQYIGTNPVQDKTGLEGKWDFNFKYTLPMGIIGGAPGDATTLQNALEKQVGLKLEEVTTSRPVIVVEKVNRVPSPNDPDIAKKIPDLPTEFEVATIKPSPPAGAVGPNGVPLPRTMIMVRPGGSMQISGMSLKQLIQQAWSVQADSIIGAQKWMDTDVYDIVGKVPVGDPSAQPNGGLNVDSLPIMLRALLADRFKLATHFEDRPMTAYTLTAPKPKLKKADPASRTKWSDGGTPIVMNAGSGPSRSLKFQNMSMAQFAESLQYLAGTYIHSPVIDGTSLEGSYDFTLTFSPIAPAQLAALTARPPAPTGGDAGPSDPISVVSIFEAVEKQLGLKLVEQKRPVSVLVIDHVEEKPTEN